MQVGETSDDNMFVTAKATFNNDVLIGSGEGDDLTVNSTTKFNNNVTLGSGNADDIIFKGKATFQTDLYMPASGFNVGNQTLNSYINSLIGDVASDPLGGVLTYSPSLKTAIKSGTQQAVVINAENSVMSSTNLVANSVDTDTLIFDVINTKTASEFSGLFSRLTTLEDTNIPSIEGRLDTVESDITSLQTTKQDLKIGRAHV